MSELKQDTPGAPPAAPAPAKKGNAPVSVRPKDDFKDFLEALIKDKGSSQAALEHCIRFTKNGSGKIPPKPVVDPKPTGFTPEAEYSTMLEKIQTKKKLTRTNALNYCIRFTHKNDWL